MNFSIKRKIWFGAAQVGARQVKINEGCVFTFRGKNPYVDEQYPLSEDNGTHHTVDETIIDIPEDIEEEFTVFLKLKMTDFIRNVGGLTLGYYTGDYAPEDQYYTSTNTLNVYDIRSYDSENFTLSDLASYEVVSGISLPEFEPTIYHVPTGNTTFYSFRIPIVTGSISGNSLILEQLFSGLLVFNNLEYYFGM